LTGPVSGDTWNQRLESPEAVAMALHKAFPAYSVIVRRDRGEPRFQLISLDGRNPTCLISADAQEIWNELNRA
jgi:hypothetical protein